MWPNSLPALGFGTSNVLHYKSSREVTEALQTAYESGIKYFDTAPIYGFGWAERFLGQFLKGKRNEITIVTKAGLDPGSIKPLLPFGLISGVRTFKKAWSSLAERKLTDLNNEPMHTSMPVSALHHSLDRSLRQLQTDYIDILLLHEATVRYANQDDILNFASNAISSGKVRAVGIGSARNNLSQAKHLDPIYTVMQTDFRWTAHVVPGPSVKLNNVYGIWNAIRTLESQTAQPGFRKDFISTTGVDLNSKTEILQLVLSVTKHLHSNGITLFSSTHPKHIREMMDQWNQESLPLQQVLDITALLNHEYH